MRILGTVDLRCDGTLHGRLTDERWLEVKCNRRRCGYRPGTVILHTIDIKTGELVRTRQYASPKMKKEGQHAADNSSTAVRAS